MSSGDDTRGGEERFLDRWSRLKRTEQKAPAAQSQPQRTPSTGASPADAAVPDTEAAAPEPPLPDIDALKPDSDIAAFFRKGVPEELRRRAMRRMWTLDPAIRDFVEMAENQYDFNAPDSIPGFGTLDPGTDIAKLVAQATGQDLPAEPAAVAQPEVASHAPDPATAQDANAAPPEPANPVRQSSLEQPADAEDAALLGSEQADEDPPPGPSRRRHGGALPV
jgi:hypothetical protein